jgi:hypothetical protein
MHCPSVSLTRAVEAAFPEFPIYGGAFDDVVPHLTIRHNQPSNLLREAERNVQVTYQLCRPRGPCNCGPDRLRTAVKGLGTGNGPMLWAGLERPLFG